MQPMIRIYRRRKGLTQQALADAIGRSRASVAEYESGASGVPIPILWKIARVLEVPVDVLFAEHVPANDEDAHHA